MKKIANEQAPSAPSKEFFSVACPPTKKKAIDKKVLPTRRVVAFLDCSSIFFKQSFKCPWTASDRFEVSPSAPPTNDRPWPITSQHRWLIFPHVSWYSKCITNRVGESTDFAFQHLGFANFETSHPSLEPLLPLVRRSSQAAKFQVGLMGSLHANGASSKAP